jgi:hypothetical protein
MAPQDAAEMAELLAGYYPELPVHQRALAQERFQPYEHELVERVLKDYRATHSQPDLTGILDLCRGKSKVQNYRSNAAASEVKKKKTAAERETLKEKIAHFGTAKREHLKSTALAKQEPFVVKKLADRDPLEDDVLLALVAVEAGIVKPKGASSM